MKKKDLYFVLGIIVFVGLFIVVEPIKEWFLSWSAAKDYRSLIMAFLKFGILSTIGECIGLRITSGVYSRKGFGILPRFIVWGVLGTCISIAMMIFSSGVFTFLNVCGLHGLNPQNVTDCFGIDLLYAFCVSFFMNTFFAPVFMTVHKITDTHINQTGGTLKGFFSPIPFGNIIKNLDWDTQWNFVFKKTIPFFWYPAHTITFLLPSQYRVLFAAFLGVALGIILSIANLKKTNK